MPVTACAWLRSSVSASRRIAESVLTALRFFALSAPKSLWDFFGADLR